MVSNRDQDASREQIQKMLLSSYPDVRKLGWERLYSKMRPNLYKYLLGLTGSEHDAEDFVQRTFLKVYGHLENKTTNIGRIEGTVYITAKNLLIDELRKKGIALDPLEEVNHSKKKGAYPVVSIEDKLILEWKRKEVQELLLHIPSERYRLLALDLYTLDLSPKEINICKGWSLDRIYKGNQRIIEKFRDIYKQKDKFITKPHPWKDKLSFTGLDSSICVAYMNIYPHNFSHESEEEILKTLGVKSLDQLWAVYVAMLRYEAIGTEYGALMLTFLPRTFFSEDVLNHGKPVDYVAYNVDFYEDEEKGKKKKVLFLRDGIHFKGRVLRHIKNDKNDWVGIDYEFPAIGIWARKAFTEKLIYLNHQPESREELLYIYQIAPLEN